MNIGFLVCWEFNHPTRRGTPWVSPRLIQKLIGNSYHLLTTSSSVGIYVLLAQHLVIRIETVHFEGSVNQIDRAMDQLCHLNKAVRLLHQRFGSILLTVFISNTVDMTTCSYHLIRSLVNKELFSSSWNAFQIAQNLFEIILMCWTADHLARSSVFI